MTTTRGEREYRVGVFRGVDIKENGRVRVRWTGYTTWLNESWPGFQGWFTVVADSHAHAVSAAIKEAKAKRVQRQIAEGQKGLEQP